MKASIIVRRLAKELAEIAEQLKAAEAAKQLPKKLPRSKPTKRISLGATERVMKAMQRAPEYADNYPGFAHILRGHAITRSQLVRAMGNTKQAMQALETGLQELMTAGKVKVLNNKDLGLPTKRPKIYVLAEFSHLFDKKPAEQGQNTPNSDPFSHFYQSPFAQTADRAGSPPPNPIDDDSASIKEQTTKD